MMVTIVAGDGITLATDEDASVSGSAAAVGNLGDTLSYGVSRAAAHGTVQGDAVTGAFTYTPAADFFGNDSFDVMVVDGHGGSDTLRVEVSVAAVNDAPRVTTTNPFTATGNEEAAIAGAVTLTDPEGDRMTFQIAGVPKNGRVNIDQNGTYAYTGNTDFFGEDTFTVLVTDALGASTEVPVTVTVDNVQDAPRFLAGTSASMSVTKNIAATRSFYAIDPDGDAVTYHAGSTRAQHGDLGIDPLTGAITYTPDDDYIGPDLFTLEARDASGNVSVLTLDVGVKADVAFVSTSSVFYVDAQVGQVIVTTIVYENYLVQTHQFTTERSTGSLSIDLPVADYVFGVFTANATPTGTPDPNFWNGVEPITSRTFAGAVGYGAENHVAGSYSDSGTMTIFGASHTSAFDVHLVPAAEKPPIFPIDAFDVDGQFRLMSDYPADTFEESYARYRADYASDIFADSIASYSTLSRTFQAIRGDAFAQDPAFLAFLDQVHLLPEQPDYYPQPLLVSAQLAANSPGTTTIHHSYSGSTNGSRGSIVYVTVKDNNLPLVVVTPVGGTFQDTDGDGDFDFQGTADISFRGSDKVVLHLTGATIEMDPSVLHVSGATVYAAISEGAGLHDALFKGSFDIDRSTGAVLSFSAEAPPEGDGNPYYAPGGLALTYSGFSIRTRSRPSPRWRCRFRSSTR